MLLPPSGVLPATLGHLAAPALLPSLQHLAVLPPTLDPLPGSLSADPLPLLLDLIRAVSDAISSAFFSAIERVRAVDLLVSGNAPSSFLFDRVADVDAFRNRINDFLLQEREIALVLTVLAALAAPLVGLISGDRSGLRPRTIEPVDDELRVEMSPEQAIAWDNGIDVCDDADLDAGCDVDYPGTRAAEDATRVPSVDAGTWLELVVCIVLDVVGITSFFIPDFGEFYDLFFAIVYAFCIELFFDWRAAAAFAFWEEALPYLDFIPTATIVWMLSVTGGRALIDPGYRQDSEREGRWGASNLDYLGEPNAYGEPEPYLREGNDELFR